jgi:HSP20 family protein
MLSSASPFSVRSCIHFSVPPAANVFSTPAGLQIDLDLPGVKRDSLRIDILKGKLNVSGNRSHPVGSGAKCIQGECVYGPVFRTFDLPEGLATDALDASFNDGVLSLVIPKMKP